MPSSPKKSLLAHVHASDLRAVAQLAVQGTAGVARLAEGVQQAVWRTVGAPSGGAPGSARGITGLVYQSIQGVTALVGKGLDKSFAQLQPWLEPPGGPAPETPQRAAVLAALNGVLGDHLAASGNPLATAMTLRHRGEALDWQALSPSLAPTPKVLLLVHGLCMNDLQWRSEHDGVAHDHGAALAAELGYTPIYLRYNSGQHTSQNGRALAQQLQALAHHWPVPLQEVSILAHSMGGLVARSAVHMAQQNSQPWLRHLQHMIFLGTPHHGAPLERAGNWVDVILGTTPYSAPFAKLGQLRSAGITDLRFGHTLDSDWAGRNRFARGQDTRTPLPLPLGISCYAVAATTAAPRSPLSERWVGDGLVPLQSALGQHDEPERCLRFSKTTQWVAHHTNHMQLLSSPRVLAKLMQWLTPSAGSSQASSSIF